MLLAKQILRVSKEQNLTLIMPSFALKKAKGGKANAKLLNLK